MSHKETVLDTMWNWLRDHMRHGLTKDDVIDILEELLKRFKNEY